MNILRHRSRLDEVDVPRASPGGLPDPIRTVPRSRLHCEPGTARAGLDTLLTADRDDPTPTRTAAAVRYLTVDAAYTDLHARNAHAVNVLLSRPFRSDAEALRLTLLHLCMPSVALLATPVAVAVTL